MIEIYKGPVNGVNLQTDGSSLQAGPHNLAVRLYPLYRLDPLAFSPRLVALWVRILCYHDHRIPVGPTAVAAIGSLMFRRGRWRDRGRWLVSLEASPMFPSPVGSRRKKAVACGRGGGEECADAWQCQKVKRKSYQ